MVRPSLNNPSSSVERTLRDRSNGRTTTQDTPSAEPSKNNLNTYKPKGRLQQHFQLIIPISTKFKRPKKSTSSAALDPSCDDDSAFSSRARKKQKPDHLHLEQSESLVSSAKERQRQQTHASRIGILAPVGHHRGLSSYHTVYNLANELSPEIVSLASTPPPPICGSSDHSPDLGGLVEQDLASPSTSLIPKDYSTDALSSSYLNSPPASLLSEHHTPATTTIGYSSSKHKSSSSLTAPRHTTPSRGKSSEPVLTSEWIQADRNKPIERDIRTFFNSVTAPQSTTSHNILSSSPGTTVIRSSSSSFNGSSQQPTPPKPTTTLSSTQINNHKRSKITKTVEKRTMMTQLVLDISNSPTTKICKECGMSYVLGVVEDLEIHEKHHREVVRGIEWNYEEDVINCKIVWRDQSEFDGDRIYKISLDPIHLKRTKYKNKVFQILRMVNFSLGAQDIDQAYLNRSCLYIYVGTGQESDQSRKSSGKKKINRNSSSVVLGACVAGRIEEAYQIVEGFETNQNDSNNENHDRLIRLGEDSNTFYCSPIATKVHIGIHRIWTSIKNRRRGIAKKLLEIVSLTLIYGLPILNIEDRKNWIGFSQPSHSGNLLIKNWLDGQQFFNVFF